MSDIQSRENSKSPKTKPLKAEKQAEEPSTTQSEQTQPQQQTWIKSLDPNTQLNYYWNPTTNVTSWEIPPKEDRICSQEEYYEWYAQQQYYAASVVAAAEQGVTVEEITAFEKPEDLGYNETEDVQDYSQSLAFNSRSGKFQSATDPRNDASNYFLEANRADRQMSNYFDVAQYNASRQPGAAGRIVKQKKYSKREMEIIKQRKKVKKQGKLIEKYAD